MAALGLGFGIETDVRDSTGRLVVAHDTPVGNELELAELVEAVQAYKSSLPIAFNIKSDGLAKPILDLLGPGYFSSAETFFFDMSVPQHLHYSRLNMPLAVRVSEYETAGFIQRRLVAGRSSFERRTVLLCCRLARVAWAAIQRSLGSREGGHS